MEIFLHLKKLSERVREGGRGEKNRQGGAHLSAGPSCSSPPYRDNSTDQAGNPGLLLAHTKRERERERCAIAAARFVTYCEKDLKLPLNTPPGLTHATIIALLHTFICL